MTDKILLSHGSGGKQAHDLITQIFITSFGNSYLNKLEDSAILFENGASLAFTTDGYVVKPRFFPGGDVGKLAVCGTVNDLSVAGAIPEFISCGFIIEEGFPVEDLQKIVTSMRKASEISGVKIVTGDTKVVENGAADGIFITTAGIGRIAMSPRPSIDRIETGDVIIINGDIGDHGISVMAEREGLKFNVPVVSDCAPLSGLIRDVHVFAGDIRFMRDPTRGGLATVLNEISSSAEVGIEIYEDDIPVSDGVQGMCELLGLDPLYVANEGKVVMIASEKSAPEILKKMRANEYGAGSRVIGRITAEHPGKVSMKTPYGGSRIIDMLTGDQLPRIC
ncbi:MAG TPA: hydrogenase expression/formation protein HypE [bacterium]|nr:hydrogenase expression/formation protein HypE [bacterium]